MYDEFQTNKQVFLHADLTFDHFLVTTEGQPKISGVIDMADCQIGHFEYELCAPTVFIFKGDKSLLRKYLIHCGFSESQLNRRFSEKLLAWSILHRYFSMISYFKVEMDDCRPGDFSALAEKVFPLENGKQRAALKNVDRIQSHSAIARILESLSDEKLLSLLENATPMHIGIDGKSFSLPLGERRIFVKRIPLSVLEMKPENLKSTANLFKLPMFCQYGLGAPGFGSRRELIANQLATKWVLAKACEHFSLLYHWRVLPATPAKPLRDEEKENLEKQIQFWGNSNAIRERFEGISHPAAEIVLFLEFVPQTLSSWLKSQHGQGVESFSNALAFAEKNLNLTIGFMKDHGLIHFDTHFENIMTDGQRLYFNDFGLALHVDFDLTDDEIKFFKLHQNYDQCRAAVSLMHAVVTAEFSESNWKENLKNYLASESKSLSPVIASFIRKYGPLALAMIEFSQKLKTESLQSPYPGDQFAQLQAGIREIGDLK